MDQTCACRKCGGSLAIEYIGNYGTTYHLRRDGTVGRRLRSIKYESSGDYMVYCQSCGTGYDGRLLNGKFVQYSEE